MEHKTSKIVNNIAHDLATARLREERGSVFEAFDGLSLGFDHDDVLEYLGGAPAFMALPEDRRGLIAGLAMAFALIIAEAAWAKPQRRCRL